MKIFKKVLALLLSVCMAASCCVGAFAVEIETNTVSDEDLFITQEVAQEIAKLFVTDMIDCGVVSWTDETQVMACEVLYDGSEDRNINAYSFELDEGYVVVSAYLDSPSLILEWSDMAEPVYSTMDSEEGFDVVYTGVLGYFQDTGEDVLTTVDGVAVARTEMIDQFTEMRDISNVSQSVLDVVSGDQVSVCSTVPGGEYAISDPYAHANMFYEGPFLYYNHQNWWDTSEDQLEFSTLGQFKDIDNDGVDEYDQHCGPTAITNILFMYRDRFGCSYLSTKTPNQIFIKVAEIGTSNSYYYNASYGGTVNAYAGSYLRQCFNHCGISGLTVSSSRLMAIYYNIEYSLRNDRLLYLMVNNHSAYGNHHMVGYAYVRMISSTTDAFKTFLKVADGHNSSPRYIDLATITSDEYWEISY